MCSNPLPVTGNQAADDAILAQADHHHPPRVPHLVHQMDSNNQSQCCEPTHYPVTNVQQYSDNNMHQSAGACHGGGVAGLCNDGAGHVYPECYMLNSMQTLKYSKTSDSIHDGANTKTSLVLSDGVEGGLSGGGAGGIVVAPSIH